MKRTSTKRASTKRVSKKRVSKKKSQKTLSQKRKSKAKKNKMSVETCKRKKISKVMSEFKLNKLKMRNGQNVKNRKQAIAIALNTAERLCE